MYKGKRIAVLIAAAGKGERMGAPVPKQFLKIGGKTLLEKSIEVFENNIFVDEIYVVISQDYMEEAEKYKSPKLKKMTKGANTRQQSVYEGLKIIEDTTDIVLVHDAARPYVGSESINFVIDATYKKGAAVPAVKVKDTIKIVREDDIIIKTPERNDLYSAQTPQGFDYNLILRAHRNAVKEGFTGTDDAVLVERMGYPVYITRGDAENIKITDPKDMPDRNRLVGIGYDVHAFSEGRDLILGGIKIPYERGLMGHSDADVLTHAFMDAILGALNLGDIGTNFPDTDPNYKNIKSTLLLENVKDFMLQRGYTLENADLIIIAEKPKMKGYIPTMCENLAVCMDVDPKMISIKATTTEGLGFTGREEGIGSQAIVQLISTIS